MLRTIITLSIMAGVAFGTDCKTATTRNEKLMCIHSKLAPLDVQMRKAIKDLKKTSSLTEQRDWIFLRDAWCSQVEETERVRCLERSVQARLNQLREPVAFPYLALYHDYAPHLIVNDPRVVPELKLLVRKDFDRLINHYERMSPQTKLDDIFEGFRFKGWVEADAANGVDMILNESGEAWVIVSEGKVWSYYSNVATSKGRPPATFLNAAASWKTQFGDEIQFKMSY